MKRDIYRFTQNRYDVLIVGGGINGAAIAHMAAFNGLKTALLEKGDFASGTSSKSTKLIHGGLRYLENFELGLVRESLKERSVQLKSAPHLVRPLKFIIPVYAGDKRPLWLMKIGVKLYDILSGKHVIEKHKSLNADDVCREAPGIRRDGLIGGVMYSDAQTNDARLCLENVMSAEKKGAHVANYVRVVSFIKKNNKVIGVNARDELTKKEFEVEAKKIVCAVGPWTNIVMRKEHLGAPLRVRPTKGVHIICRGTVSEHAVLIPTKQDQRVFFVIPWMGNSLIGTTDTDFSGDPDDVQVKREDVDYLINETKRVLPDARLDHSSIIASFAGLRPLVSEKGSPAKVSRKHVIRESFSGMIYVMGGKYTTYRKIAEDVLRRVTRKRLINTRKEFPVYGSGKLPEDVDGLGQRYDMDPEAVRQLMQYYGVRFWDVLKYIKENPSLKVPICGCSPVCHAQIIYSIEKEMARTVEDIVMRRLLLGYDECPTGECREAIRNILSATKFR